MNGSYKLTIKYQKAVMYQEHIGDQQLAIARLINLITEKFPYALGEIIDLARNITIFECKKRSIC